MNINKILSAYSIIKYYQEINTIYKLDKHIKLKFSSNDLKRSLNNSNNINNKVSDNTSLINKTIIYKSKIISNIQFTLEELYNIFFSQKNFERKKYNLFFNIVFELLKSGVKIKEFYSLCKINIPFYISEKIFYENYLGIDKEKYIQQILNNSNVENSNIILPFQGNLFIPINSEIPKITYKNKFMKNLLNDNNNKIIFNNEKYKIHFFGELLYLIRPVIYLTLLAMFKDNEIIPLLINMLIDVVIYFSRLEINVERNNENKKVRLNFLLQKVHYLEMKTRNKNYFMYLFREPIYTSFFRPLVGNILKLLHLPICIMEFIFSFLDKYINYCYIA